MREINIKDRIDCAVKLMENYPNLSGKRSFHSSHYIAQESFLDKIAAAKNGDIESIFDVAQFYRHTIRDRQEGWLWMEYAASLGDAVAQRNMAIYYQSEGDFVSAIVWAEKALGGGESDAQDIIDEIRNIQ